MGSRSSVAMKPMIENVTNPPNMLVNMSPVATTNVSLRMHAFRLLRCQCVLALRQSCPSIRPSVCHTLVSNHFKTSTVSRYLNMEWLPEWMHLSTCQSRLPDAVVVELVIAGQSDESAPAQWQREEHLDCCVSPHLYSTACSITI